MSDGDDTSDNSDNEIESNSECNSDSENKKHSKNPKKNNCNKSNTFLKETSICTSLEKNAQINSIMAPSSNECTSTDSTALRNTLSNKDNLNNIMQFSRSSVGGSKYLINVHLSSTPNEDLMFESRFESGNLAKVIKITPVYYELYLRADLYTNKHTQWFYFRVTNTRKNVSYRCVVFFSVLKISK